MASPLAGHTLLASWDVGAAVMTTAEPEILSIERAIDQLTRMQREELAEWMLNAQCLEDCIAEPLLPYRGRRSMTVEEYLDMEAEFSTRYEYVAGQIFALGNPLIRHEVICANMMLHFQTQLRGGPCLALSSRTKVRMQIDRSDIFYKPDLAVACGPFTEEVLNEQYLTEPCIIVEVMSASTNAIDQREKSLNYRRIPSLEEYLWSHSGPWRSLCSGAATIGFRRC
jgi:Uma2 family endonuclease